VPAGSSPLPGGSEGRLRVEFGLAEKLGLLAPIKMQDVFGTT
jgi:hypothetical protein